MLAGIKFSGKKEGVLKVHFPTNRPLLEANSERAVSMMNDFFDESFFAHALQKFYEMEVSSEAADMNFSIFSMR